MKIFRSIPLCFALSFLVAACDDRLEFVNRDNKPPSIYFQNSPSITNASDSLKLGADYNGGKLKGIVGQAQYHLLITGKDLENDLSSLSYTVPENTVVELFAGEQKLSGSIPLENGRALVSIKPVPGLHEIKFQAVDNIGKMATASFTLFAFKNLGPVAKAVFTSVGTAEAGLYKYEFDARGSFDRDVKFGGAITKYEYVINDTYVITTDASRVYHHFAGPGTYRVKYRVFDNEGAESEFVQAPAIQL